MNPEERLEVLHYVVTMPHVGCAFRYMMKASSEPQIL